MLVCNSRKIIFKDNGDFLIRFKHPDYPVKLSLCVSSELAQFLSDEDFEIFISNANLDFSLLIKYLQKEGY